MSEPIERASASDAAERSLGGWRAIASAWLVAMIFALVFAAADAVASRHEPQRGKSYLAGVEIPRHDPSVPGPDEIAASDSLQRVKAEAFCGW
jgi:hypothetical protein